MSKEKYYTILGLPNHANNDQVKRAYRKLALIYHPDINPSYEEKFKEILEAYQILTNKIQIPTDVDSNQNKIFVRRYNKWFTVEEYEGLKKSQDELLLKRKRAQENKLQREYQELLHSKVYKSFSMVAVFGVLFAILLCIDYFSPTLKEPVVVSEIAVANEQKTNPYTQNQYVNWYTYVYVRYPSGQIKKVELMDNSIEDITGQTIQVIESSVFRHILSLETPNKIYFNKYQSFIDMNLVLAFTYIGLILLTYFVKGPTPFYYMVLHLTVFGIPITLFLYLFYVTS